MENETNGLKDEFLARHTRDPALCSMLSNRETLTTQRPTEVKTNLLSINYRPVHPHSHPRGEGVVQTDFL